MKRSEINEAFKSASLCFQRHNWHLPPSPKWDITDFGLGNFSSDGLVLVNLAQEREYCEKLMYAIKDQKTPIHYHKKKKEDIICRNGELTLVLWKTYPEKKTNQNITVSRNGEKWQFTEDQQIVLKSGERITIEPLIWHTFYPSSLECIIGEVSTANDDVNDNFFANSEIGRYSHIIEDVAPDVILLSEKMH